MTTLTDSAKTSEYSALGMLSSFLSAASAITPSFFILILMFF
jgi:hypothetical protein